jgi:thiol-disulfide isomerase/thioredoxin
MRNHILITASVLLLAGALSGPAANSLGVGGTAPAIKVAKWVKGSAVEKLASDKLYVVEFWATWCPPCRRSIPHLTELAKKYQGKVEFIGVSVWEREKTAEDRLTKVTQFVREMGAKMQYTVALDDPSGFMAKEWMTAAGQDGIPAAFIVQGGKIAWIGHPMDGLDEALGKLTSK